MICPFSATVTEYRDFPSSLPSSRVRLDPSHRTPVKSLPVFLLAACVIAAAAPDVHARQDAEAPPPRTPRADYLDPPRISTPLNDALRESLGESTAGSAARDREFDVRFQFRPYRTPQPKLLELKSWGPLPEPIHETLPAGRRGVTIIRPTSLFDDAVPAATLILAPRFEEASLLSADLSVVPSPFTLVNAAAADATRFPGEVIEEVIVPVPSEIFAVMDKLGRPDWKGELRRTKTPTFSNRVDVALLLGSVVAEGFLAVQAEDKEAVERIGKDVLRLSESLGLKETVLPHTNSILEASRHNHWEIVRVELDKTQKTVRDTMEQRRDAELGQCVSLGGWLRGTDAVTSLISKSYSADAAELLNQPDIIRHFQKELKKLATRNGKLKAVLDGLAVIATVIGDGDDAPSAAGVQKIHETSVKLVKSITSSASAAQ